MSIYPSFRRFAVAGLAAACLAASIPAQAQLLEYEGFDYTATALAGLAGGTGWAANTWADADNDVPLSGDATSLQFTPVTSFTPVGARISFLMSGEAERRLGTPMSLASATNWYFSALVKRQGDFRIEFMDNANNVRWRMGANGQSGVASNAVVGVSGDSTFPDVFPTDETVFMIGKISVSASANDVVSMNVYRAGQVIPAVEPSFWQASGGSASGVSLTRLQIRNISDLPLEVDEIRIGTTFESVAGPKLTGPPIILAQPLAQTNYQGTEARFTVDVIGQVPFSYVWKKDGVPVPGGTNALLILSNLSPTHAGNYSVDVTNPAGSISSASAALTVISVSNRTVGMTAYWNFDETAGLVAKDSTTNLNDGALLNFAGDDTQWVPTFDTRGLALNGQNYVQVQDSPTVGERLRNRFSLAVWFKSNVALTAGGNAYRLLEKENSFFLLQGDNTANLGVGGMNLLVKKNTANLSVGIGQALLANRWYHMAVTYDGNTFRVYLDGQLRGSREIPAPIDGSNLPLNIGADYTAGMTGSKYFNGTIDEVALWERPLMESEILALAGKTGAPQILEQPKSVVAYAGGTAIFTVGVTRGQEPLRYLWYHGTEEIRTANGPVLTLYGVQAADAGEYRCRVSNDLGEVQTTTASLTVTPVTGVNDALQLSYSFNETTGLTAADASTFARNGDLLDYFDATSHWVPGKNGNALKFDGFMNRLVSSTATNMGLATDATVSFWINPEGYGTLEPLGNYSRNVGRVIRKGGMLDIQTIDDPGSVRATILANGVPAQQNCLALNEWQHFVVVYQGNMISFYKNGIRLGDPAPGSLGGLDTNSPLVLGNISDQPTGISYFQGALDDVKVWTRILTETEILTLAGQDAVGAPVIVNQPQPATRYAGGSVSFSVSATGLRPISYEWRRNGVPIPDSNTNRLALAHLSQAHAGDYTVVLQNGVGSPVTSSAAQLIVKEVTGVPTGLVAYWPFNETAGAVLNDASGRGHHGALQGFEAVPGNAGVVGGSYYFDGLDDFIVVPHASDLSLADQATISVWVSPSHLGTSAAGGLARIIRKDINYDVNLYSPISSIRMYGVNKAIYDAPANSFTTNQWQHLAIVMKDGFVQFYKNGLPLGAPVPGALGPATSTNLIIANFGADLSITRLFMGNMDELGLWERALTPAEVDGVYQNGLLGRPLNAVFEPLQIRNLSFPSANQARVTFYSPYVGREHVLESRNALGEGSWTAQAGVAITSPVNGVSDATFTLTPDTAAAFYRIGLKPRPAIFSQDFETSVTGWTHGGPGDNWEWGTPVNGPKAAHSGSKVYATSLTGNLQPYSDAWLRTPPINMAGLTRATLSWYEWRNIDPTVTFHYAAVNLVDAASGSIIQQLAIDAGGTTGYEPRSISLPAQAMGKSIIIEFLVHCDDFNLLEGWYIDDVTITPE